MKLIAFAIIVLLALATSSLRADAPSTRPSSAGTVAASAEEVSPLSVGSHVPSARLTNTQGTALDLGGEVAKKPTVLIFYRGGWCPFCNRQLAGLQGIAKDLQDNGYQLLAVSPDRPEELVKSTQKQSLEYTLLSDSDASVVKAFGLAFKVSDEIHRKYIGFKIDIEKASGEKHHILPVPAVYILGTDGVVKFVHFDPNYKNRMDPAEILKQARLAIGKQ